jgi:hypothetical protein|tara:strand:+ start:385 stop:561 length:177 start_codon:yes stop_codon:yes gene_type:complete
MNDDEVAQLNLFSGLAMHALINRATHMPTDSRDLAVRAVEIAEELMIEIASARDRAED